MTKCKLVVLLVPSGHLEELEFCSSSLYRLLLIESKIGLWLLRLSLMLLAF